MTQKWNRKNVGLWFVGILSLILAAIGIRYAQYTDWWAQWVNRDQQNWQTVNTGASVFVATMKTPGDSGSKLTPDDTGTGNPPIVTTPPVTEASPPQRSRMW